MIIYLQFLTLFEICPCDLNPRQLFISTVQLFPSIILCHIEMILLLDLQIPYHDAILIFLPDKQMDFLTISLFHMSGRQIFRHLIAKRTFSGKSAFWFLYHPFKLGFIRHSFFPPCIHDAAAFGTRQFRPAFMFSVIQIVPAAKQLLICILQNFFFRKHRRVLYPVFQRPFPSLSFSVPLRTIPCMSDTVLPCLYMIPPSSVIHKLASIRKLLQYLQILIRLHDISFVIHSIP